MQSAVLFLIFNRPDTTRQVFAAIRQARPPRLYVAADGPRPDRSGETALCFNTRRIATTVDWPCEVKTLFREKNLGCKHAVSEAISWFFENEEEGIVLEDDVLPTSTFFPYCEELLDRYRHDQRIAMISGCNLVSNRYRCDKSYFFSYFNHVWGWASWRRAWIHYDMTLEHWPEWRQSGQLSQLSHGNRIFVRYWRDVFDRVRQGTIDTWDYQWLFTLWRLEALAILPTHNLTQNVGFGSDGTHTMGAVPRYVQESVIKDLSFPLRHPCEVQQSVEADLLIASSVFGINRANAIKRAVIRLPGVALLSRVTRLLRGKK